MTCLVSLCWCFIVVWVFSLDFSLFWLTFFVVFVAWNPPKKIQPTKNPLTCVNSLLPRFSGEKMDKKNLGQFTNFLRNPTSGFTSRFPSWCDFPEKMHRNFWSPFWFKHLKITYQPAEVWRYVDFLYVFCLHRVLCNDFVEFEVSFVTVSKRYIKHFMFEGEQIQQTPTPINRSLLKAETRIAQPESLIERNKSFCLRTFMILYICHLCCTWRQEDFLTIASYHLTISSKQLESKTPPHSKTPAYYQRACPIQSHSQEGP